MRGGSWVWRCSIWSADRLKPQTGSLKRMFWISLIGVASLLPISAKQEVRHEKIKSRRSADRSDPGPDALDVPHDRSRTGIPRFGPTPRPSHDRPPGLVAERRSRDVARHGLVVRRQSAAPRTQPQYGPRRDANALFHSTLRPHNAFRPHWCALHTFAPGPNGLAVSTRQVL